MGRVNFPGDQLGLINFLLIQSHPTATTHCRPRIMAWFTSST